MSTATEGEQRRTQSGSHLSDRQISQAAVRGRKVTFQYFGSQPTHEVVGYVVGMDSYHWFVASVVGADRQDIDGLIVKSLVHKARPDLIQLHDAATLDDEPADVRAAIQKVGQSYWDTVHTQRNPR